MPSDELTRDTIAAVATPAGRGGIGVLRVSGSLALAIAKKVVGRTQAANGLTRVFRAGGAAIDQGIALYFPAPHSYTGEAVLCRATRRPGRDAGTARRVSTPARASPSRASSRAALFSKVLPDLAQAEAVVDLHRRCEPQRRARRCAP